MRRPGTFQLMRIFGIRVGASTSWFFVLFFFVFTLSSSFRSVLSSDTAAYTVAIAAALAFFGSVILHELAHALVARRAGIEIEGIDLWFFGGVARMRVNQESDSPGVEFKVAVAGPLITLAVFAVCVLAGVVTSGWSAFLDAALLRSNVRASAGLLLVSWLAVINAAVFLFNMVPAFPLDGGRIARAVAWRVTGDRTRGTRASARLSQAFALLLGAVGLYLALLGFLLTGVWAVVMAFLLGQAARGAVMQSAVSARLAGVTVADIMDRDPVTVPRDTPMMALEEDFFRRYRAPWFAVVDSGGRFLGIVRQERVQEEIGGGRPALSAGEVLEEGGGRWHIGPEAPLEGLLASEGLRLLGGVAAVDADGVLRGVVTLNEVRRALTPVPGL